MTVALWCVLIAAVLPVISAGIAKWGTALDNNHPRDWADGLTGYRRRAYAAHHNAFEAFPFFAAAVLTATVLQAPAATVNALALTFIAARIAYLAFYVSDNANLRSIVWIIAWAATIAIFTAPSWAG
jgi:uncharacterized MAPEG superfamily protein